MSELISFGDHCLSDVVVCLSRRTNLREKDISAIAISPNLEFGSESFLVAVGTWGDNQVHVLAGTSFEEVKRLDFDSLPRSIVICQTNIDKQQGSIQVMVGLGDGTVETHGVGSPGTNWESIAMSHTSKGVGATPVRLVSGPNQADNLQILALSDKLSVIYEERDRLSQTFMNVSGITSGSLLDLTHFGSCILIANSDGLELRSVRALNRLHIRKIDLGFDNPLNITHMPSARVFGVSISRSRIDQEYGDEVKTNFFRIFDDTSFQQLGQLELDDEIPTALSLVQLQPLGPEYFALGTTVKELPDDSGAPSAGFVRLFEVDRESPKGSILRYFASVPMQGTVYDIKSIWGQLAVAVDNRVDLLSHEELGNPVRTTTWGNAFIASCLSVRTWDNGDERHQSLHVGDGMRSLFSLELDSEKQLVDVNRDMRPHWIMTMEEVNQETGLVAFSDVSEQMSWVMRGLFKQSADPHAFRFQTNYNFYVYRDSEHGEFLNPAKMALHETITKFRRGEF